MSGPSGAPSNPPWPAGNFSDELGHRLMHDGIVAAHTATGRPMAYYICAGERGNWSAELGTLWRTSPDIIAPGETRASVLWAGMLRNFYATAVQQVPPWSTSGNHPGGSYTCGGAVPGVAPGTALFANCPGPVSSKGAWRDADVRVSLMRHTPLHLSLRCSRHHRIRVCRMITHENPQPCTLHGRTKCDMHFARRCWLLAWATCH